MTGDSPDCRHMIPLQKNRTEEGEDPCPILALLPHISIHNDTWTQEPDLSRPMHTSPWDVTVGHAPRGRTQSTQDLCTGRRQVSLNLRSAALGQ